MRFTSRYPTRFLRSYVRIKTAGDPVYGAVFDTLRGSSDSIVDLGCGIGVLEFYLRERGVTAPIAGIDRDARKVSAARAAADGDRSLSFDVGDVRAPVDLRGTVILADVLHYLTDDEQASLLDRIAASARTIIIRDGLRDRTLRYWTTVGQETLARAAGWLRVDRLNFPTRETIERPFRGAFAAEVRPMFGRTPFNNYLFVFRRSSPGTTNV